MHDSSKCVGFLCFHIFNFVNKKFCVLLITEFLQSECYAHRSNAHDFTTVLFTFLHVSKAACECRHIETMDSHVLAYAANEISARDPFLAIDTL